MTQLNRRTFLKAAGAVSAAASPLLSGCGEGMEPEPPLYDPATDDTLGTNEPALIREVPLSQQGPRIPNSMAKASAQEVDLGLNVLSGALPTDLLGHLFMVAALPYGNGNPVLTGDGMVMRLDFGSAKPQLKSRVAKTPCYYADKAAANTPMFFAGEGYARRSAKLGIRNQPNTAFVELKEGRLLVTSDSGRPYELDTSTLELVTPVGALDEWKSSMPSLIAKGVFPLQMSTAHPVYDFHTGELFTVNFGSIPFAEFTNLVRWDGKGKLESWKLELPFDVVRVKQSVHQIGVTQDYILLMDTAFFVEPEQVFFPSQSRAQMADTPVYIVRRKDLVPGAGKVAARRVLLPREVAHFAVDYENPNGRVTVHTGHGCATDVSEWLRAGDVRADNRAPVRKELAGMVSLGVDIGLAARHVFDAENGVLLTGESKLVESDVHTWGGPALFTHAGRGSPGKVEDIFWDSLGFNRELVTHRIASMYRNYKYRRVALNALPGYRPPTVFRLDAKAMTVADGYSFLGGKVVGSPQFVPRNGVHGGSKDGYLVVTVVSDDTSNPLSSGDEFWVFDAANLMGGPLCRLGHPSLDFAFTLHTAWLPQVGPRTSTYRIPVRQDLDARVKAQSADVHALFEQHVYPHFPA